MEQNLYLYLALSVKILFFSLFVQAIDMRTFKVNCMLLTTVILWSSAFVGIRIGLNAYTPGSLALLRFLVASTCMAMVYPLLRTSMKIPRMHQLQLLLLGMLGIGVYSIALNVGEVTVTAGVASFIIGIMPIITVIFSALFLSEKTSIPMVIGIVTSLAGLLIMAQAESSETSTKLGMLYILLSAMCGSIFTIMLKRYLKHYHPVAVIAWAIWGGTILLLFFAKDLIKEVALAPLNATASAVYLGVFPAALAYVSWSYVLNFMQASRASVVLYVIPLLSTLMGVVLLQEQLSVIALVGGIMALIGAIFASSFRRQI